MSEPLTDEELARIEERLKKLWPHAPGLWAAVDITAAPAMWYYIDVNILLVEVRRLRAIVERLTSVADVNMAGTLPGAVYRDGKQIRSDP